MRPTQRSTSAVSSARAEGDHGVDVDPVLRPVEHDLAHDEVLGGEHRNGRRRRRARRPRRVGGVVERVVGEEQVDRACRPTTPASGRHGPTAAATLADVDTERRPAVEHLALGRRGRTRSRRCRSWRGVRRSRPARAHHRRRGAPRRGLRRWHDLVGQRWGRGHVVTPSGGVKGLPATGDADGVGERAARRASRSACSWSRTRGRHVGLPVGPVASRGARRWRPPGGGGWSGGVAATVFVGRDHRLAGAGPGGHGGLTQTLSGPGGAQQRGGFHGSQGTTDISFRLYVRPGRSSP